MFTWNFQYISKARLAETFSQLMLNPQKGDILIRIHTAIHTEKEAVDLARFIKSLVPAAGIMGISTPAPVGSGSSRVMYNQCSISVSQMSQGHVRTSMLLPDISGEGIKEAFPNDDLRLLLAFFAGSFREAERFAGIVNDELPGVCLAGGLADISVNAYHKDSKEGFVFNEAGCSNHGILVAAFDGKSFCVTGGYATGIHEVDIKDQDRDTFSEELKKLKELPDVLHLTDDGKRLLNVSDIDDIGDCKMAFVHDEGIISDDRKLFQMVEGFSMTETILCYICSSRAKMYPGCTEWELSVYENSNICGCVMNGVFAVENGKNLLTDWAFSLTVAGEEHRMQRFNPYVFSYTEALSEDNNRLLSHLVHIVRECQEKGQDIPESVHGFVRECENKLLRTAEDGLPNEAALILDMKIKGYDRVCMINVLDASGITAVFPEGTIRMTKNTYIGRCRSYAHRKNYHTYKLDKWMVAVAAPAYLVKLSDFISDMEELQRSLFRTVEGSAAIVPTFCILDDCDPEYLRDNYNAACNRMKQKNLQFYVYDSDLDRPDVESIRERYRMVDVINSAIEGDRVFPYFQGIYDNRKGKITHYEALMRIADETGRIYYPAEFLDVAHSYGLLYDTLSMTMIRKVFDRFRDYKDKEVSINLSMRDIKNRELVEFICSFLATASYPGNFVFEILENEDVDDYEYVLSFVDRIHSLGGCISIDDFGSGYSNLMHVISIHADYIKIDGSIVRRCSEDKESEHVIAMISGWRALSNRQIGIVAEFVENDDIQKMIEKYGIDFSQGYLFAKPAPDIE